MRTAPTKNPLDLGPKLEFDKKFFDSYVLDVKDTLDLLDSRIGHVEQNLRNLIYYFQKVFRHSPVSAWLKLKQEDGSWVILTKNLAYDENHGTDTDYIGEEDDTQWGDDEAANYHILDEEALLKGYAVGFERAYNRPSRRFEKFIVFKSASLIKDHKVVMGIIPAVTPLPRSALFDGASSTKAP